MMPYVFTKHEKNYEDWKNSGMNGIKQETRSFIENILRKDRKHFLWKNQQEGILRVIYFYEILGDSSLLLNIVTGGGKTIIIAGCIAWLKIAYNVDKFLIVVPNTIVRDRLKRDFAPKDNKFNVFEEFELFPEEYKNHIHELVAHVLGEGDATGMFSSGIILGNIHQFYTNNISGKRNVHWLLTKAGNIALFNDEAHNTPATEYTNVLTQLKNKVIFRLDTTATPDRADGTAPDSDMIYWYSVSDALDDGIIKSVVVYQPDSKAVELTYTNKLTGERKKVTDLDKDFKEAESNIKPFQWILDEEPMRKQMALALARLKEQKGRANGRYNPILFVVTTSIDEGRKAKKILEENFDLKNKVLLVTEDTAEEVVGKKDDGITPLTAREAVQNIGKLENKHEAVVSVLMLREGWDVPEVSVILLLRKLCSPVYGQQIIGRGLRKIIRKEGESEILSVIDHPKLDHNWLWVKVGASRIRTVELDEVLGDEDIPKTREIQRLVRPENIIVIPEPIYESKIDFDALIKKIPNDEIEKNWREFLNKKEYEERWTISKSKVEQIIKLYVDKKRTMEIIPSENIEVNNSEKKREKVTDDDLKELFKEKLVEMASELLFEAGFGGLKKGILYNELLSHIKKKIFNNKSLPEASRKELEIALENIEEIKKTFTKPIISGILKGY